MKLVYLSIISIILLLTTGCGFWYTPNSRNNTSPSPEPVATSTSEVDTSDWLTYENKEYGFGFRYPKDWKVKKLEDKLIGLVSPELEEQLKTNRSSFNRDLYLKVYSPITDTKFITKEDGFKGSFERVTKAEEIRGLQFIGDNRAKFIEFNSF